jgi:peptidoglycan lytic transglycosylase
VLRAAASLFALAFFVGCASHAPASSEPSVTDETPASGASEHGKASYYSNALAGHKTASGERYDPKKLTAAHRTLPFGTVVDVARKDGRHVRVRINDRGPFVKGRVIDLSRRAAEEIGLTREGVAEVTLTVVDDDP